MSKHLQLTPHVPTEEQLKAKANELAAANARVGAAQAEERRAAAESAQSRETVSRLSKSLVERDSKASGSK